MRINLKCSGNIEDINVSGSEIWNCIILSLSFTFVFTAYVSIQNLQSSLNQEEGLGVISLSCLYACLIISATLAPTIIKLIGGKLAIVITWIVHIIYTTSNFYPTFATLIPSSILLGLISGVLWTSQSLYIAVNSESLAKEKNNDLHSVMSRMNGMFFMMFESTQIIGNLISSLVLTKGTYNGTNTGTKLCGADDCPLLANATKINEPERDVVYMLLGIYLGSDVIGLILTTCFLSPLPMVNWNQTKSTKSTIISCFSVLGDIKLVLLVPQMTLIAMKQAFMWTDFTKSFISCPFGVHNIGFVMAAFGGSTAIFNLVWSNIARFAGRYFLFGIAAILDIGIYITLYLYTPVEAYYVYIIAVACGVTEGIWHNQSNSLIALLFSDKIEPAYANYHCWKSVGFTVSFVTSNFLCVSTKLFIIMTLLVVSIILYIIVEVVAARQRRIYNIAEKVI